MLREQVYKKGLGFQGYPSSLILYQSALISLLQLLSA
uniref:Uncharacterized protein n=1 Tax=Anguilla anguilla TaxID=7936 RepID=A0A0E9PQ68_ANGAN